MRNFIQKMKPVFFILLLVQTAVGGGVDGAWDFVFHGDNGDRPATITISTDGEQANAKMWDAELKGTFKDGRLVLAGELYVPDAGYSAELKIDGRLDSDKITGDASWDTYEVTFSATRSS